MIWLYITCGSVSLGTSQDYNFRLGETHTGHEESTAISKLPEVLDSHRCIWRSETSGGGSQTTATSFDPALEVTPGKRSWEIFRQNIKSWRSVWRSMVLAGRLDGRDVRRVDILGDFLHQRGAVSFSLHGVRGVVGSTIHIEWSAKTGRGKSRAEKFNQGR